MARGKNVIKITNDPDILRNRADEINTFDNRGKTREIVGALKRTLKDYPDLIALSAPQIGYNARIFCIRFNDNQIKEFINPMISKTDGLHLTRERCKSISDKEYIVPRNDRIIAIYQELPFKTQSNKFDGAVAEVFQQMTNLLDGILIDDIGLEVLPEFDKASKEEQDEVINWYIDQLKSRDASLNEEIEKTPELKQVQDAINYMTKVATGEIELYKEEEKKPEADAKESGD